MSAFDLELPGVLAAMEQSRARAVMVLSGKENEGGAGLARALAEACASRARRAALLVDLDVAADRHFAHYAQEGEALSDFRSGVFDGATFFKVGAGAHETDVTDRFLVGRVGRRRLYVSHFERAGLGENLRFRLTLKPDYWRAARLRADYVIVDAPAREACAAGIEIAPMLDGVVLAVSGAHGSAAASVALKAELQSRGARVLGFVYTDADPAVAWLESLFATGARRSAAAP